MDGIKKIDPRYVAHHESVLNNFGTNDRQEVNTSIRRMKPLKETCHVLLMNKELVGQEEFEGDGLFNNHVALPRLRDPPKKCNCFGEVSKIKAIRAGSTIQSYRKVKALKKQSDKAEKPKVGNILALVKVNIQTMMPGAASKLLNHCLQMFKHAVPIISINKIDSDVELGTSQSFNPLESLNNKNHFYANACFHSGTKVSYICLRASTF